MEECNNITYRKLRKTSSLNDISRDSSALFDATIMSLPNTTLNTSQTVLDLNEKVKQLSDDLLVAHQEIENLNLENFRLKTELQKHFKVIEAYKIINTTENNVTPKSRQKRKAKQNIAKTPTQKSNQSAYLQTQITNEANFNEENDISELITAQQSTSKHEILKIKQKKSNKCTNSSLKQNITRLSTPLNNNSLKNNILPEKTISQKSKKRNKICILSSNNKNKILPIAESTFSNEYDLCHYIKPGGGTKQLLEDLQPKLIGFTMDDFCIVLLGEEDFKTTNNYVDIIVHMRESLQVINHTNVIICSPTFICGNYSDLSNWRIETFNHLLHLDILTHEHAFVIDSNVNLKYDHSMFYKHSGRINNFGLHTIFKDILHLITDIRSLDTQTNEEEDKNDDVNKKHNTFFLD